MHTIKDKPLTFVVKAPEGPRPIPTLSTLPPTTLKRDNTVDFKLEDIIKPPPEVEKAIEENPNWIHNWMYSIVPGPAFEIYLAGFCKNCRVAFTHKLKVATFRADQYSYFPTDTDVPKYGCVGPS